jgi:hypothetical protein
MKHIDPSRTIVVLNVFDADFVAARGAALAMRNESHMSFRAQALQCCAPARGTCARASPNALNFCAQRGDDRWNTSCTVASPMQTTLGDLVSELVESYEREYEDAELAAVATSVTIEELFKSNQAKRVRCSRTDDTVPLRKKAIESIK